MRDAIVNILLAYVKKHRIHASKVILELFAEELIAHGVVIPTQCQDCKYRTEDGHCFVNIEGVSYKKTHPDGYCEGGYCDNANDR